MPHWWHSRSAGRLPRVNGSHGRSSWKPSPAQLPTPTAACPAFGLTEAVQSRSGTPIGRLEFCLVTDVPDGAGGDTSLGTATFSPGGTISTTVTLVEVANTAKFVQTDSGTIIGGTGIYFGATGTMSGKGTIAFDPDGSAHPDLTFTLTRALTRAFPFRAVDSGAARVIAANGSAIDTADTATGRATLLGRFTLTAGEHIDLATGAISQGEYTFTAWDGASVTGTYSGHALSDLTGYLVSGPITGGTGRLTGASGFLVWRGTLDPTAFTFADVITGWISPSLPVDARNAWRT